MARTSKIIHHVSNEQLEQKLKEVKGFCRIQRILVILSLQKNAQTSKQLSVSFNLSEITIRKLISFYNKFGMAAIDVKGQGGRKNEIMTLEEEKDFLKQFFDKALQGKIATAEEIRKAFIKKTKRTKVAKSTIYDLLKRHGWSKKKARPSHPKSDKQAQEAFKKNFDQKVEEIIKAKKLDKSKVVLLAQDEGRFGRITDTRSGWCPPKERPIHQKQIIREYFYVFAAVCPKIGKLTALILPDCNTEMMNLFLKEVNRVYKDNQVIMQVDGASWHTTKTLRIPSNIHFVRQPAYSPEVNPAEHIWDDIREKEFNNEIFDTMNEAMDNAVMGIKRLSNNKNYLSSLTGFDHLMYNLEH